jgi:hypothetical protein
LKDLTVPVATTSNLKTGCNVLRIVDLNRRQPAISQTFVAFFLSDNMAPNLPGYQQPNDFKSLAGRRAAKGPQARPNQDHCTRKSRFSFADIFIPPIDEAGLSLADCQADWIGASQILY